MYVCFDTEKREVNNTKMTMKLYCFTLALFAAIGCAQIIPPTNPYEHTKVVLNMFVTQQYERVCAGKRVAIAGQGPLRGRALAVGGQEQSANNIASERMRYHHLGRSEVCLFVRSSNLAWNSTGTCAYCTCRTLLCRNSISIPAR